MVRSLRQHVTNFARDFVDARLKVGSRRPSVLDIIAGGGVVVGTSASFIDDIEKVAGYVPLAPPATLGFLLLAIATAVCAAVVTGSKGDRYRHSQAARLAAKAGVVALPFLAGMRAIDAVSELRPIEVEIDGCLLLQQGSAATGYLVRAIDETGEDITDRSLPSDDECTYKVRLKRSMSRRGYLLVTSDRCERAARLLLSARHELPGDSVTHLFGPHVQRAFRHTVSCETTT